MLVHTVFFWLKPELDATQRAEFRRGVESLAGVRHATNVYVGGPAPVAGRPVVDKSFDVGLTVVFDNLAAHDAYQADPIHQAFVANFGGFWSRIRVYDSG